MMRLSEALMLATARKLDPSTWNCNDGGCLLGNAGIVSGHTVSCNGDALRAWPWLTKKVSKPDFLSKDMKLVGSRYWEVGFTDPLYLIQAMAIDISRGDLSYEQVAEWVASIEPKEEEVSNESRTVLQSIAANY